MNDDLRKEIAGFFLTDSSNYLARYDALIEAFTDISTRSKILVDLLFSFECSLKSLIFLRSGDDEKKTYKKIRTHDLNKLLSQINTAQIQHIADFIINEKLDDISVGVRYTLEANIKFREHNVLGQKYHDTIASYPWINEVYKKAKELNEFVRSESISMFGVMPTVDFSSINLQQAIENGNRIKNINNP